MLNIDISTEEKKKEVLETFKTFTKVKDAYEYYNVCANTHNNRYIHKIAREIGFSFKENKLAAKETKYCLSCGKKLDLEHRESRVKFCDQSCAAKYNNRGRIVSEKTRAILSEKRRNPTSSDERDRKLYRRKLSLKQTLFRDNLKEYKCECCGISDWQGKKLTLQLHHINGDKFDNRIENLQILCPNCHSQTDNFCHKNRKIKGDKPKFYCKNCGKELTEERKTGLCSTCYNESQKKGSKCPSLEELRMVWEEKKYPSYIAQKYGVSLTTARKWLKKYGLI